MMPLDGRRSTMIEVDMQLFYVEFDVLGAKVHNPTYFKPKFEKRKLLAQSVDSDGVVSLTPVEITTVDWQPWFDPDLDATFRAKYVAKAVVRRIDPPEHAEKFAEMIKALPDSPSLLRMIAEADQAIKDATGIRTSLIYGYKHMKVRGCGTRAATFGACRRDGSSKISNGEQE